MTSDGGYEKSQERPEALAAGAYVVREHTMKDPIAQVGTVTHGGPNQWRCGQCCWTPLCPDHRLRQDGDGTVCPGCNGKGWYAA